jgi:hypothetical protein
MSNEFCPSYDLLMFFVGFFIPNSRNIDFWSLLSIPRKFLQTKEKSKTYSRVFDGDNHYSIGIGQ